MEIAIGFFFFIGICAVLISVISKNIGRLQMKDVIGFSFGIGILLLAIDGLLSK